MISTFCRGTYAVPLVTLLAISGCGVSFKNPVGSSASVSANQSTSATLVAVLAISDGPTYDFGGHVTSTTATKTFTLSNSGTASATLGTITSASLGLSAPFALDASSTCVTGAVLAASASCTIVVDFAPSAITMSSGTVSLLYNDGVTAGKTLARAIQGAGTSICTGTESHYNDHGTGTALDPYLLCTPAQLMDLMVATSNLDKNFQLVQDIDLAGHDQTSGVRPIGS